MPSWHNSDLVWSNLFKTLVVQSCVSLEPEYSAIPELDNGGSMEEQCWGLVLLEWQLRP
jgi:hypothetical protein